MEQAVRELLELAGTLGEPPTIVGKAEVDQINIISRWIHRHSNDRAFFPFQHALVDENEAQALLERMWAAVDAVRSLPLLVEAEEEDGGEVWD
jgi:DNA polymerase-3 subunit epsilon